MWKDIRPVAYTFGLILCVTLGVGYLYKTQALAATKIEEQVAIDMAQADEQLDAIMTEREKQVQAAEFAARLAAAERQAELDQVAADAAAQAEAEKAAQLAAARAEAARQAAEAQALAEAQRKAQEQAAVEAAAKELAAQQAAAQKAAMAAAQQMTMTRRSRAS